MNTGTTITYAEDMNQIANGLDINTIMTFLVVYCSICGIVTALVAKNNGRSVPLAFFAGFFLGQLGIITHMIMGKNER